MASSDNPTDSTAAPTVKQQPIPAFTPRKTVTGGGGTKVTLIRSHIAAEMDEEFVICDIDVFMNHYLPFVPDDDNVESCLNMHLTPNGFIDDSDKLVFKLKGGDNDQRNEKQVYAPLADIAKYISAYKFPDSGDSTRQRNEFHYRNVPDDTIKAHIKGSDNKIDACFTKDKELPKGKGLDRRLATWAIAVPIEQKLTTERIQWVDNNQKIVSANLQIMNDDVRRMFTFGITIEATYMTLWYHSRSHSAVSRSFDFVEEPKKLIKVFMSFLYATEAELGYDPMVQRQDDGEYIFKISHEIVVKTENNVQEQTDPNVPGTKKQVKAKTETIIKVDRFYRTVKVIAGFRPNNITGRMPRVWIIEDYDPATQTTTGKKFVLKDVWLEVDTKTERQIQTAIFEDIEKFGAGDAPSNSPELAKIWAERKELIRSGKYKELFLHIDDDYSGTFPSIDIAPGAEPVSDLFTHEMRDYVSRGTNPRPDIGHASHTIQSAVPKGIDRDYKPKKRYQVVFKEICTTVGALGTLGEAMDVLQEAHLALQLLYCAGWVHRDISDGNILAHRPNLEDDSMPWKGKLMDLEYARKFPPEQTYKASADPKTGTPYFMATEILHRLYTGDGNWNPDPVPIADVGGFAEPDPDDVSLADTPATHSSSVQAVVHNFQHDLESLWWLILWIIVSHVKDQPKNNWQGLTTFAEAKKESQKWAAPIFQNVIDHLPPSRMACFMAENLDSQLKSFMPAKAIPFAYPINLLKKYMYTAYLQRAKDGAHRNKESYANIHRYFAVFFTDMHRHRHQEWRSYILNKKPAKGTSKATESASKSFKIAPIPTRESLPLPAKVKVKRGPDQNPNVDEGRAGGSKKGTKRSRQGL